MKAVAVFPRTREVKLIDVDEPQIDRPNQVKLRMLEVGICGTDRDICAFAYGAPPEGCDYLIIGHESLGVVAETGSAVQKLKVGDLAVPMVRRPCSHPECRGCHSGRPDFCSTGEFTERGIKQQHGFMSEFVVDEEQYLCAVPHHMRGVAVLVEPLTIAEKSRQQVWKIQQRLPWIDPTVPRNVRGRGQLAVVLGAGAVGLLGALELIAAGFDTYVYDMAPAPNPKSQIVEMIGGKYICAHPDCAAQIEGLVGKGDIVYEAIGDPRTAVDMLKLLGPNSIFVLTGVPSRKVALEMDKHWRLRDLVLKNQVIVGVVNAGKDSFTAAIEDLAGFERNWPQVIRSLMLHRYPLGYYHDVLLGKVGGIKNVITIGTIGD